MIDKAENRSAAKKARAAFFAAVKNVKPRPGSWLRGWRRDHAISQTELANALDVSFATVLSMEKKRELPLVLILALENLPTGQSVSQQNPIHTRGASYQVHAAERSKFADCPLHPDCPNPAPGGTGITITVWHAEAARPKKKEGNAPMIADSSTH